MAKKAQMEDSEFLSRLVSLLNSEVRTPSEEVREKAEACETLKWCLTRCIEDTLKIDAFDSDFELASFLAEHVNAPIQRLQEQIEKPWLKDKFTVGLLGHYSTGKTTALNLILDENLPINKDENTAVASYLTKGTSSQMSIVTKSGQALVLTEEDSKILDYATGKKKFPFARIFNYVVKENSSSLLDDITIIDTPGLGKKLEHSEPTIEALNSCDGVIWFIKVSSSIETADLKFIKEHINGKPLFVVISFVDDAENPENAINVIQDTFAKANIPVEAYFQLGCMRAIQQQFTRDLSSALSEFSNKHNVYDPNGHLYSVLCFLEDRLTMFKRREIERYNIIDRETDKLLKDYKESCQTFNTEHNTCQDKMRNLLSTFVDRCYTASFCGGASGALDRLLDSYNDSFSRMSEAYNALHPEKLIAYGNGVSVKTFLEYRSKRASEIIEQVHLLKTTFE